MLRWGLYLRLSATDGESFLWLRCHAFKTAFKRQSLLRVLPSTKPLTPAKGPCPFSGEAPSFPSDSEPTVEVIGNLTH